MKNIKLIAIPLASTIKYEIGKRLESLTEKEYKEIKEDIMQVNCTLGASCFTLRSVSFYF